MIFILEALFAIILIVGVVSVILLIRDAESGLSRRLRGRLATSRDDALMESPEVANHASREDGSVDLE